MQSVSVFEPVRVPAPKCPLAGHNQLMRTIYAVLFMSVIALSFVIAAAEQWFLPLCPGPHCQGVCLGVLLQGFIPDVPGILVCLPALRSIDICI